MDKREAIEILNKIILTADFTDEYGDMINTEPYEEAINLAIKAIEVLKNERQKGEWLKINPEARGYAEFFRCSNCLTNVQLSYWDKECDFAYCPNCGADMREGDEK